MRTLLLLVFVTAGCGKDAPPARKHGPALSPVMANQLRALAPECEVKTAQGATGKQELRLCRGPTALMTIHLDDQRNLLEVETGVIAPIWDDAKVQIEQAYRGFASDAALAALFDHMKSSQASPVVVDGVRVNGFFTREKPADSPKFTAVLSW